MVTFGTTEGGKQDALGNVQRDIESVRGIMTENIERVLERGERIDLLVDKTDRLGVGAHDFRVRSRGLKRQMWWKNVKLMVLLGVVVVFLVYLFVGFGCGLPGESRSFFFSPLSFRFGTAVIGWSEMVSRDGSIAIPFDWWEWASPHLDCQPHRRQPSVQSEGGAFLLRRGVHRSRSLSMVFKADLFFLFLAWSRCTG